MDSTQLDSDVKRRICKKCNNKLKLVKRTIKGHSNRFGAYVKSYDKIVGHMCLNSRCENFNKLITPLTGRKTERKGLAQTLWEANASNFDKFGKE